MGLIIKKEIDDVIIAVWKTTESLSLLEKLYQDASTSHIKLKKRKKEFLSIRLLMKEVLPNTNIRYDKNGSPRINNYKYISIAHSKDLACIIIGPTNNGIDIECVSCKSLNAFSKFGNDHHLKKLTKEKSTLIWAMKESIFKWHKKGKVNFKKDIIISDFDMHENGKVDAIFQKQKLIANYFKVEDQYLAYVC